MLKSKKTMILMLLLSLFLTGCGTGQTGQPYISEGLVLPEQTNYKTTTVQTGGLIISKEGKGSVIYPFSENLYWETKNSYLKSCNVRVGAFVKKGDVLAVFDVQTDAIGLKELQMQLQRAQEAFAAEKKERANAIAEQEANAQLLTGTEQEIANLQIQKKKIDYDRYVYETQRNIASLQADIDEIRQAQKNNTLVAPFDGIVSTLTHYEEGALVDTNKVYIKLSASDRFLVQITDSADALQYNMDMPVEVKQGTEQRSYLGKVVSVPGLLPVSAGSSTVLVQMDQSFTVQSTVKSITYTGITTSVFNITVVDKDAVHRETSRTSYVYILEDGMPKKRFVKEGLSNATQVWILDGLEPGQTLILN